MLFISHRFFSQFIWHSDSCSYFIAVTLFLNLCDQKSLLLRHLFFMNFYKCQRKWRGILSTPLELGMPSKKKNSLMFIEGYYYTAHIQHLIILLTVKLRFFSCFSWCKKHPGSQSTWFTVFHTHNVKRCIFSWK